MTISAISIPDAPKPAGPYSQGIVARGFLFTAGFGPQDPHTGAVADSVADQTRQVLRNIGAVLAEANATFADVVKVTVHLSDTALFARYNAIYARRFSAPYPVRTTVGSDLRQLPGMLIEADCIAYAPQEAPSTKKRKSKKAKPAAKRR